MHVFQGYGTVYEDAEPVNEIRKDQLLNALVMKPNNEEVRHKEQVINGRGASMRDLGILRLGAYAASLHTLNMSFKNGE